jgi:hypothetical protein
MSERESIMEQESRLRMMSEDDGDTWDLSDNDKAACLAGANAIRAALTREVCCLRHDAQCESELTSHGYTPCRCEERSGGSCPVSNARVAAKPGRD